MLKKKIAALVTIIALSFLSIPTMSVIAVGDGNTTATGHSTSGGTTSNNIECSQLPPALQEANGCSNPTDKNDLGNKIQTILNGIIGVAGIIAVIFVIIGGINYMTSGGDTAKLKKAKDTILYATIGLIICALSFAIVNWVISIIPN